ncbi:hypothetical protein HGA91_05630 [candidate division WWE3 bacterium]|nr:hypothetical protein [candidate division WWE3 bacterium]
MSVEVTLDDLLAQLRHILETTHSKGSFGRISVAIHPTALAGCLTELTGRIAIEWDLKDHPGGIGQSRTFIDLLPNQVVLFTTDDGGFTHGPYHIASVESPSVILGALFILGATYDIKIIQVHKIPVSISDKKESFDIGMSDS